MQITHMNKQLSDDYWQATPAGRYCPGMLLGSRPSLELYGPIDLVGLWGSLDTVCRPREPPIQMTCRMASRGVDLVILGSCLISTILQEYSGSLTSM